MGLWFQVVVLTGVVFALAFSPASPRSIIFPNDPEGVIDLKRDLGAKR
jgi:hypothetical protein